MKEKPKITPKINHAITDQKPNLHFTTFNEDWVKHYIHNSFEEPVFIIKTKMLSEKSAEVSFFTGIVNRHFYRAFVTPDYLKISEISEKRE